MNKTLSIFLTFSTAFAADYFMDKQEHNNMAEASAV